MVTLVYMYHLFATATVNSWRVRVRVCCL